jgi:ribose transport system substrate-binding protein
MKRILVSLAVFGLMVGAAQAQVSKTMAVSVPTADHGWTGGVVFHAMEEAKALEKKYPGLKVIVKTSPDPAAQADALEDLSTQGIDALVVLPHDPNVLTDPIRKVKNKGTFVTVVDRIADDRSIYDLYVGGDNPGLGASAAQFFKKAMPNGGDIVVIRGLPIPIDKMRVDAFNDGIKGAKINVIDSQFGNWSRDDAFKVMQDFLTKHPKIDAVWCQDDDMAIGVFEAIAQAKRTDIKFVVAGAGAKDAVKRVMDGDPMMPVDVLYSPSMVAVAMDVTAVGLEEGIPVRGDYILKATLITKDNAKDFYFKDSPF